MRGEKGGTGGARERPQNDRRDAKGSTLDGGTAKATAADLQREKTPRNGRARARPLGVFPAQNVVFVNPPKDSPPPEYVVHLQPFVKIFLGENLIRLSRE